MLANAKIYAYATTILNWCKGTKIQIRMVHGMPKASTDLIDEDHFPLLLEGEPLELAYRTDTFPATHARSGMISLEGVLKSYVEDLMESEEMSWYEENNLLYSDED